MFIAQSVVRYMEKQKKRKKRKKEMKDRMIAFCSLGIIHIYLSARKMLDVCIFSK